MGYPYGKRYIDQIRENGDECRRIKEAFYLLRLKYARDHYYSDDEDLGLETNFALLGEAFSLESNTVGNITDNYHFMWDVIDELLTPDSKKAEE